MILTFVFAMNTTTRRGASSGVERRTFWGAKRALLWWEQHSGVFLLLFGGQQRPLMHCALRAQSFLQLFNTFSLFFISQEKISLLHGFPKRQYRHSSSNANDNLHKLSVPKRKVIMPVPLLKKLGLLKVTSFSVLKMRGPVKNIYWIFHGY